MCAGVGAEHGTAEPWSHVLAELPSVVNFPWKSDPFLTLCTLLLLPSPNITTSIAPLAEQWEKEASFLQSRFVWLCVSASISPDPFMLGHAVSGGCTASCEVAIATIDKARLSETWPAGNVIFSG